MSNLREQVEQAIQRERLFRRGQPILAAVSGGVDSMVLLQLLDELSEENRWLLTVAHLNHGIRGRSSDADERLVRRTAEELGLALVVEKVNVPELAGANGTSIEMAARKARHEFLARTATRLGISSVALAHHADDQLELFFLRLLRGSGGEGLAGMKFRNSSPSDKRIELVRPLLEQPKAALREYAMGAKVAFREDASNASLDVQRNRIRHELLPLLRKNYQPSLVTILLRTMDILGADAEFAAEAAREWLRREHRSPFEDLPLSVQRRCVQLQLIKQGVVASYDLVEQLRLSADKPVCVAGAKPVESGTGGTQGWFSVLRDFEGILRRNRVDAPSFVGTSVELNLSGNAGEAVFDGLSLSWRIVSGKGTRLGKGSGGQECFDANEVGPVVLLRHWRPGDRFQPIGMKAGVKLQDIFVNQKVPAERRRELVMAATATGETFWVEGLRIAERFKLAKTTNRRLHWMWRRL